MITKIKKLQSNHLDLQRLENIQLSIQFSLDGFSFCLFDLDLQEFIAFNKYTFEYTIKTPETLLKAIKTIFINEKLLQLTYSNIMVTHVNKLSTLVPQALFNKDSLSHYIKFNNKVFNTDYYAYDSIANKDMVSVYVPYVNVNNFLIDQFGSFHFKHYSSVLVEKLLNNYSKNSQIIFYVHVRKFNFEIIVIKNKKLLLFNTFVYNTKEDFIYYVLFVIEQLKLDVETIALFLLGSIKKGDSLYDILYTYIRNVSFLDDFSKFNAILSIDSTIKRENFTLFESAN